MQKFKSLNSFTNPHITSTNNKINYQKEHNNCFKASGSAQQSSSPSSEASLYSSSLEFSLNKPFEKSKTSRNIKSGSHSQQLNFNKDTIKSSNKSTQANSIIKKENYQFDRCFLSPKFGLNRNNNYVNTFKTPSESKHQLLLSINNKKDFEEAKPKHISEIINYNNSSSSSSSITTTYDSKIKKKKQLKKYSKIVFPKQKLLLLSSNSSSDPSPPPLIQIQQIASTSQPQTIISASKSMCRKLHEFKPVIKRIKKQKILSVYPFDLAVSTKPRIAKTKELEAINSKISYKHKLNFKQSEMKDKLEKAEQSLDCVTTSSGPVFLSRSQEESAHNDHRSQSEQASLATTIDNKRECLLGEASIGGSDGLDRFRNKVRIIKMNKNNNFHNNNNNNKNKSFIINRKLGEIGEDRGRPDFSEIEKNKNTRIIKSNLKGKDTKTTNNTATNRNTTISSSYINQKETTTTTTTTTKAEEAAKKAENILASSENKAILITSSAIKSTYSLHTEEEAKRLESCFFANNTNPSYSLSKCNKNKSENNNSDAEIGEEFGNSITDFSNVKFREQHIGLVEDISPSSASLLPMKRSKMSMNLAGIEPEQLQKLVVSPKEAEVQSLPDTISTTHTTTSKTTKKTTKFMPIEQTQNANSSDQQQLQQQTNQNNKPISGITSILKNFNSATRPESSSTNLTKIDLTNGATITTEKSANVEAKYEKNQRFILEERTNSSLPPPSATKISSLRITPTSYNEPIRYIDDDEDYSDSIHDRIVPKPRPDNFRSGLKESIDQLDKLIKEKSPDNKALPAARSNSSGPRPVHDSVGNSFHPTWDEWKQKNSSSSLNRDSERLFSAGSASKSTNVTENNKSASKTETRYSNSSKTHQKSEYSEEHSYKYRNNNKQEYQLETQTNSSRHQAPVTLQINNSDKTNMKNKIRLNLNDSGSEDVYHSPTPIVVNDGSTMIFGPQITTKKEIRSTSTNSRQARKENLTKRLEQIFYNQITENTIPITPITQAQTHIKQVLSRPNRSDSHSPTKRQPTGPRHPVYPIDRKPERPPSPIKFGSAVLAKQEPVTVPVVQKIIEAPPPETPKPKKICKTILSTRTRKNSAPNLGAYDADEYIQPQLVVKHTGAIPIEYISIRRDPEPKPKIEVAKKSITIGTNTNVERGMKIASTNTNTDELPQYNLHVSLDSLFIKQRREASTETEIKNTNVGTETETRHRDACTVTDDEGEVGPTASEQYLYQSHNSRYAEWETRSNPPEDFYRLEFLTKSPRTIHRKNIGPMCSNNHVFCSTEDIYGFNRIQNQGCYKPVSCEIRADDDDILIFGPGGTNTHHHQCYHQNTLIRRSGSIPNLCYVAPVVQCAPPVVRRFVKTTQYTGCLPPQDINSTNQIFMQSSNTNLAEAAQISSIQSKFDEIFGIQRSNSACYSTHSLGFEAAPRTERYYKTTKTTNSQIPSFGEIYQNRQNAVQSSSASHHHSYSSSSRHHQHRGSLQHNSGYPIVDMPATPESTLKNNQMFFNSSQSQFGGGATSGYSSFNQRTMSNSEINMPNTTSSLQRDGYETNNQNDHLSSSSRIFKMGGGRQLDDDNHVINSRAIVTDDSESESRQFRPIFHPIIMEQSAGQKEQRQQKWPNSNKQRV